MTLFHPMWLARSAPDGGVTQHLLTEFDEVRPGWFMRRADGQTVGVYESTKVLLEHGFVGSILSAFSNYWRIHFIDVSVGAVVNEDLALPDGYSVFCVDLPNAVMGDLSKGEHFFPYALAVQDGTLAIGTTAHQVVRRSDGSEIAGPLAARMTLTATVYARDARMEPGWLSLFYESLADLNGCRRTEAVFKLAVAMELWCQGTLEVFLGRQALPPKFGKAIKRTSRNWDDLIMLMHELGGSLGLDQEKHKLSQESIRLFRENVRNPRNRFSHAQQDALGPAEAKEAYKAALDVLWTLHHIDAALRQ